MRYKIILFFFLIFWGVMVVRLYQISIKSNFYYEKLAKENIERKLYIKPVRGEIIDISGKLLAMNRIGFSISIVPHLEQSSQQLVSVVDNLVKTFPDLNKTVMLEVYKKFNSPYNHKYIKVIDFVRYSDMMRAYPVLSLQENIQIEAENKRYYPYGKYTAHIIGYTGKSNDKENAQDFTTEEVGVIGKSGLESYYNDTLQGELGYFVNKVTATNKEVDVLSHQKPVENRNLVLSLDIDLQMMIYDRMKNLTGTAVVMRTNGEILAAISTPGFDPNLFVGGISSKDWTLLQEDPALPFTNKFINGTYPPGSTIKMGVAIASSQSGKGTIFQNEHCSGHITIGKSGHKFRCWKKNGHGGVDLRKAIRESCDVFFYNKSLDIGIDALSKSLKSIGLGVKTGVDLPHEYEGVIPDQAWKNARYKQPWYKGETVISAIGQGYVNVTPMQIARYTALLATSGLVTPHFAKVIDGIPIHNKFEPAKLDPKVMDQIRLGMYDVCNTPGGTAYAHLRDLPIIVAGKTGTSQVVAIPQSVIKRAEESDMEYWQRSHALLTTYAPYDDPQYIVTVIVEHGGHGGGTNGPIVADIYKWMNTRGYFPKDDNATAEPTQPDKIANNKNADQ
jgi:penicillin-binding protein 2